MEPMEIPWPFEQVLPSKTRFLASLMASLMAIQSSESGGR